MCWLPEAASRTALDIYCIEDFRCSVQTSVDNFFAAGSYVESVCAILEDAERYLNKRCRLRFGSARKLLMLVAGAFRDIDVMEALEEKRWNFVNMMRCQRLVMRAATT